MFTFSQIRRISLLLVIVPLLTHCGGGGSGGGSSDNPRSGSTADEDARFSGEIADAAIFLALDVVQLPTLNSPFQGESPRISLGTSSFPNPAECGGGDVESGTVTGVADNSYPYRADYKTVYTDACFTIGPYQFFRSGESGRITEQTDANNGTSERFVNFSYVSTRPGFESYSLAYFTQHTLVDGVETVQLSSNYTPKSGVTYRLDSYTSSGGEVTGYDANAIFIDDNNQTYTIAFTGLQDCISEGRSGFGSGGGAITLANGDVMNIDFSSCFQYTVTYKGVATSYSNI